MPSPRKGQPQGFAVGETVYAKWPGSSLWFPAKVQDNSDGYQVVFQDDSRTVETVKSEYVKSASSFSRRKSKTPTRSRSRSRSRARSRTPTRSKPTASPSPVRQSRSRSRTRVVRQVTQRVDTPVTPTRHSARIAAMIEEKEFVENHKAELQKLEQESKSAPAPDPNKDFGGPIGAFFMILIMPVTVFGILLACDEKSCSIYKLPKLSSIKWRSYFDLEATLIFLGWLAFQAVLYMLPWGRLVEGMPLKSGRKLKYRCNGLRSLLVTWIMFGAAVYLKYPVTIVYDKFIQILTSACCFSFLLSIWLYFRSRNLSASQRSPGGNSGSFFHDFFIGRELNPRIGSFDLKFFFETRPGLIGWTLINGVLMVKQYQELGRVDCSLMTVAAMQALYVADCFWFEPALLSTMDITHDGFGFMLAYGDIVWVPGLYALQGRYLVTRPQIGTPDYCLAAILILNMIGYWVFRGSNSQKDAFRKNPYNPALEHLKSISTSTGRRLLVSGWWGLCRHPNYLGDLIMALAWSLTTGFGSIIPYFYPIYFLILLIHRERRDDGMCAQKYKASWDRYRAQVKYRIVPYVY